VETWLNIILTTTLHTGQKPASRPGRFTDLEFVLDVDLTGDLRCSRVNMNAVANRTTRGPVGNGSRVMKCAPTKSQRLIQHGNPLQSGHEKVKADEGYDRIVNLKGISYFKRS
jgi:hypothetical protein